ncbi:NADH-quinone oxidoreductase subunit N [Buchnera aphidicola]|uniref:NADH-quinone oxidoreductase subunit N n=1 Tax=Buchnera aphidicola TaxID=9 RepID=UPI0034647B70
MSFSMYPIISLLPFLILIVNVFIILFSIIVYRSHKFVFFTTIIGLNSIFLSLIYLCNFLPINVNELLDINIYSLRYIEIIIFISLFFVSFSYLYLNKFFFYREEFYILFLSSLLGSILVICSNHMIVLFLGMELMSLPIIGLMIYSIFDIESISVMLKYMILSIISSVFMLLGIVLIYSICGNLNFNSIKMYFLTNQIQDNKILLLGIGFLLISFFFKLSLFPLHFWVSDVYQYTYSILLFYITTVLKITTFFVLIKLFFYFPYLQSKILYFITEIVAIFSIIFGSIMMLFQQNIKKFIGYSSIIHMGYIIVILLVTNQYDNYYKISIIYFIYYVLSNLGLFSMLFLSELSQNTKNTKINYISYYEGLFWKNPKLTIAITVILFSFLGIPCTLGFIVKFLMIFFITYHNFWFINFAILVNSGLGIYYYLKMILNLYSCKNINHKIIFKKKYKNIEILIIFISMIIFFLGFFPNCIINMIGLHIL